MSTSFHEGNQIWEPRSQVREEGMTLYPFRTLNLLSSLAMFSTTTGTAYVDKSLPYPLLPSAAHSTQRLSSEEEGVPRSPGK